MPKQRSPKRDEAFQIWIASEKQIKLKDIASELGVSESQIRKWKNQDNWNGNVTNQMNGNVTKRKRGGQPGNTNATGPPGNKNAEKYGFFSKYLPEETLEIMDQMPTDPLELTWHQIQLAYTGIMRAQQIMYVKDKDDKTKQMTGDFDNGTTYDVQQAWDKQANFLQAQARAQTTLRAYIKQYEDLLHKNWELATEEQKARLAHIKAQTEKIKGTEQDSTEDKVKKLFDAIGGALDAES